MDQNEKEERIKKFEEIIEELKNTPEQAYKYRHLSNAEMDDRIMRALQIVDLDEWKVALSTHYPVVSNNVSLSLVLLYFNLRFYFWMNLWELWI